MNKENVLIITSSDKDINSVDSINENLIKCYKENFNCELIVLTDSRSRLPLKENYNQLFDRLKTAPPNRLVVTHPAVFRSYFFFLLLKVLDKRDIAFVFHIYGDFIRQSKRWLLLEKYLLSKKVLFIAPSNAYKNVISTFFQDGSSISEVPFSVDESIFYYSAIDRKKIRASFNIDEESVVFIYTGRISTQKNIPLMLKFLKQTSDKLQKKVKVLIVGNEDDFEGGTVGESKVLGTNYNSLKEFENDQNILLIDNIKREELFKYLSAADVFISFSLFHDEDFGCAPVESLMVGTPALLTGWGGYQEYAKINSHYCRLLKVEFQKLLLVINTDITNEVLEELKQVKREDCIELYKNKYSIGHVANLLAEELRKDFPLFKGFNQALHLVSNEGKKFFYDKENKINEANYIKVYKNFWNSNDN